VAFFTDGPPDFPPRAREAFTSAFVPVRVPDAHVDAPREEIPVQHRSMAGLRTVKVCCEVCQVFESDDSGRCPLCQLEHSGNLVDELRAQRRPA
jgi:uncharacterized paraquat-inducible protein A